MFSAILRAPALQLIALWDESQHPRDAEGKFRGKSTYVPDHDAPEKGDWDWIGVDRNAMVGPGPKWTQQHRALVKDALRAWVGDPGSFHIHAHDAIAGAPIPGSGSGKEMRAQAEALLWEIEHNSKSIPMPLYRGSGQRGDLPGPGRSYSWSEDREIALDFARRYGGVVETLPAGTAKGLRLKDYAGEAFGEAQWIVRAGNNPVKKWDEAKHPRDKDGQFTGAADRALEAVYDLPVPSDIQDLEEAWVGGVGDFGDPTAAEAIQNVEGYADYQKAVADTLRTHLGDSITAYRSMSEEEYEDWTEGGGPQGLVGVTLDPGVAKHWEKFALNTAPRKVASFQIDPARVVMRGSQNESELVVDADWIDQKQLRSKWDEGKHPRDAEGQFAQAGSLVVGDRTIQVIKPKRAMRDRLVPLDVEVFDQQFQQDPSFYLSEGGGKNAIGTRYARFGQFIAENTSIEAAEVYVGHDGRVGFTNGRHRYAWLRDQGIKTIPVAMTQESVRYAKQYGYLSAQKWDESEHPRDAEGQFTVRPVAITEYLAGHKGMEMVSVKELEQFRTEDRRVEPKSAMNITEPTETLLPRLTQELRSGEAIQEPLTIAYDTEVGRALLLDGNTRLAAIADAGFTHAPVVISRQNLYGFGRPVKKFSNAEAGMDPSVGVLSWLLPSKVGFSTLPRIVQKGEHTYGSTHIMIDPWSSAAASLNAARNAVFDEDRAGPGKDVDPNHITVRFGLLNDDGNIDTLRSFIAAQRPFTARLDGVELFPPGEHSEGAVPVVARIDAPELHAIEAEIANYAEFKEKSFPDYKPHATIAYVTVASCLRYATLPVYGSCLVHSITISHQSGVQETIPFGMTQKKEWDPSQHPRVGSGSARGGEFTDVLHSSKDALDSLLNDERAIIDPADLRNLLKQAREMRPTPNEANLMHLHLDGMRVFDQDGLGIKRDEMPQIPKEHRDQFLKELREAGVEIEKAWVDPLTLKPSQDEISARNVGEKIQKYKKGDRAFPPLLVSSENRLLDGHHHWGMITALAVEAPDAGIKVPIYRLKIRTKFALALMHAYDKKYGIKRKSVSAKWDEALHPRDEQGQWVSIGQALSKTGRVTEHPKETAFLLPDGTRISAAGYNAHAKLARMAGYNDLQKVIASGIVRYVPHVGVEIGKPLTLKQAQILADDWNSEYQTSIVVETVNGAERELTSSKEFFDPTGHLLYHYSRNVFQKVQKKDPQSGRYVTPFVSFDKQGDDQLRMIASLNSSRLATWGFTAEAEVRGLARYKLTAVLDGRTSKFCRMIDGKIFNVADARRKVIEVLNVQDPEDLRVVQPWPKQTKAAMAEYEKMTPQELTERGLHIPPFHPYCRTILRPLKSSEGKLTETTPTVPADSQIFQPVTQADLLELGVEATAEQVAEWNEHIAMTPTELLSKLSGMPPQEVLTKGKGLGSNPVQFAEDGGIGIRANGSTNGVEFKLRALLDPFTSTFYLTQADLEAGNPKAEVAFLKNLFKAIIEIGGKSSATAVALAVTGSQSAYYAKLGFLPDDIEWDTIRTSALWEVEAGALQPVLASLSEADRLLVIQLLQDKSVTALSALVDLPFTYQGKTIGEWVLGDVVSTWGLDLLDDALLAQAEGYLS